MGRLLYVENDDLAREVLKSALSKAFPTVEIRTAPDGYEALVECREFQPHVVLTALHLPDMDGVSLAKEMRLLKPDVEIIAITGDTSAVLSADISELVTKPIDLDQLCSAIWRRLEKRIASRNRHQRRPEL